MVATVTVYPSFKRIKTEQKDSESKVNSIIKTLIENGLITKRSVSKSELFLLNPKKVKRLTCSDLTDDQLRAVVLTYPNLTRLDLCCRQKLTNIGVSYLAKLTKLRALRLSKNNFVYGQSPLTGDCLVNLKKLPLKRLHLDGWHELKSKDLIPFRGSQIEVLQISYSKVGDFGLKIISTMKNLRYLNIEECQNVTNRGISNLKELRHLKVLILDGCFKDSPKAPNLTEIFLHYLKPLPLKELYLFGFKGLTFCGVELISKIPTLEVLSLRNCTNIRSSRDLVSLKRLKKLRDLNLQDTSLPYVLQFQYPTRYSIENDFVKDLASEPRRKKKKQLTVDVNLPLLAYPKSKQKA